MPYNYPIHPDATKRSGCGLLARVIGTRYTATKPAHFVRFESC